MGGRGKKQQQQKASKAAAKSKKSGGGSSAAVLDQESGGGDGGATSSIFAAFEGAGSPEALRSALDEKIQALEDALEQLPSPGQLKTLSAVKDAQIELAAVQAQSDALLQLADEYGDKNEALTALLESDQSFTVEMMETGVEISDELGAVMRAAKSAAARLNEEVLALVGEIGILEDEMNSASANAAELTRLRGLWGSPALAKGHYTKHKDDTLATSELDYLTRAEALNDGPAGGTVLEKKRDGDRLRFDTSTGDFTVLSAALKIRTFFRPSRGRRYFDSQ